MFNRAGEALAKHGLKFFYHTHGYEFLPYGNGTLFDLLMSETKPDLVHFQMDVFWIVHPGQDPVKLFEKYGSRFQLMHLKDMKQGTPTGLFTGHSEVTNNVPLGASARWPAILKARKSGVKWYFSRTNRRRRWANAEPELFGKGEILSLFYSCDFVSCGAARK